MSSAIFNVTFDCADPRALARFWGQVTGWPVIEEPQPGYEESAVGMPGEGRPRLYFVKVPERKTAKNRLHLDLRTPDLELEVRRVTGLGARLLTSEPVAEDGWFWHILADPDGNEFCVLKPLSPESEPAG